VTYILLLGALQASINAATLALIDAGVPMIDYVCACTGGSVENQSLLGKSFLFYD
jgi:exosome complex component RRP41